MTAATCKGSVIQRVKHLEAADYEYQTCVASSLIRFDFLVSIRMP